MLKHAGLMHTHAQEKQGEAKASANEVTHPPAFSSEDRTDGVNMVGHITRHDRPKNAHGGDQGSPIATPFLG